MRVMCINDSEFNRNRSVNVPVPKVGDELTVTRAWVDIYDNNDPVYTFAEYGSHHIFSQRYFATLPDEPAEVIEEQQPDYATA